MDNIKNKLHHSGLSWTGMGPLDGYGQSNVVSPAVAKRDKYGQKSLNPYLLAHPQEKGFDRFGLDCLAFLHLNYSLGNTQDSMAKRFEEYCQSMDRQIAKCRIDYEEFRMFLVFLFPYFFGLGFLAGWGRITGRLCGHSGLLDCFLCLWVGGCI